MTYNCTKEFERFEYNKSNQITIVAFEKGWEPKLTEKDLTCSTCKSVTNDQMLVSCNKIKNFLCSSLLG